MRLLYIIFLVSIIIISLGIMIYLMYGNRWKCTDNGCEKTFGGDYLSKESCQNSCQNNLNQQAITTSEKDTSFICNNNYECVEVEGSNTGEFTTSQSCNMNCKRPVVVRQPTYYYYPQSLYYRRPYYWSYNRNPWRWRRRRYFGRQNRRSPIKNNENN